ncbi:MAG: SusC/RagA family TonB-linked outer membrane protein [Balneola sp.]
MFKKLQLLTLALFLPVLAVAQSGSLTGKVTDAKTGEPLPGATIYIQSLQKGDQSDVDGDYAITRIPAGTYEVSVNYIGYKRYTSSVEIGSGELVLDVNLSVDLVGLDEVIVTGYGSIDRSTFSGSVSSVQSDKLENVPVASIDAALQGKASGVQITASSGTPGSTQDIRIRGISSINAGTQPLFVIDGVPVISGNISTNGATSSLGLLSSLSNSDIESITVLKDAASTAPYGARGTNGVIVITTKSGRQGNTTYSVTAQRGANNTAIDGPDPLNSQQWDEIYQQAYGVASPWDGTTNSDWNKAATNENALQQEYSFSARGGNDQTQFYASMSVFDQEGTTVGTEINRYTGKFDIAHQLDDRVRVQNSTTGSFTQQDGILEGAGYFGSPVLAKYFMLPIDPIYNADGSFNITNLSNAIYNPLYTQENDIDRNKTARLLNNTKVDIKFNNSLTFTSKFAIDFVLSEEKNYNNIFYGDSDDESGRVDDYTIRNFNYVWQNMISYNYLLNTDNSFNFKVWNEIQKNSQFQVGGSGEGIAATGLINLATTANPVAAFSQTTDWSVSSFTGLVNYGFKDKLFVDASLRYEGNSRFAEDERWGTFYSAGLSYVLSEEEFLSDLSFLDFLKVRASYGLTGNSSVGLNQYQATVSYTGSYNGSPSIRNNTLGNSLLTWEKAQSFDLGLEFEMFEKLTGSATFFRKNSNELLFAVPLSRTTGHNSQTQNIGKLYNTGFEFELGYDVLRTRDFKWNLGGNLTLLENEVTELPTDANGEDIEITTSTRYVAVEGFETNAWFMRKWAGVDPDNGDPLWYINGKDGATTNDYNSAERAYQGASALPSAFGGINTRFDVFNFYVSADIYYNFGNKVYDSWAFINSSDGRFSFLYNQYASQYDRWQQPGDNALNPRPQSGNSRQTAGTSSRFLYDGDYLRLKNLNIGYNVPARYLETIGVKSATVFFLGQNLWTYTFDDLLEFDPEVDAGGFLNLNSAPLKSVTVGIKANF